ncbi:hypothetical protein D3C77_557000 [compost metagenome]
MPAQLIGNVSTEQGAKYTGGSEYRPEQPRHFSALLQGEDVINYRKSNRHQRSAANPLNGSINAQLRNALGHAAQYRTD